MFGDILNSAQKVGGDLKNQWDAWSAQPANKAMLVQMGLQLLQPIQPGQSPIGNIGQAVGAGFQAKNRVEKQALLEDDVNYKRSQQQLDREAETEERANKNKFQSRQLDISQQNADSLKASRGPGGASWNSLFSAGNRDQDRFENFIIKQADMAAKADTDNALFNPDYVPRAPAEYMNDPNWLAQQKAAYASLPQLNLQAPAPGPVSTPVQGTPQPQPGAQPIPKPTGATPKYKAGDIVNGYKAVIVNGKPTWQKI